MKLRCKKMVRAALVLNVLFICVPLATAEKRVRELEWTRAKQDGMLRAGEILPLGDTPEEEVLKLENTSAEPLKIEFVVADNPQIAGKNYVVRGQVKYSGISGQGYLEMLSHFAEGPSFSRTLGQGSLAPLSGDSDWRPFMLPFFGGEQSPFRLTLSLSLPSSGVVYVSRLELVDDVSVEGLNGLIAQSMGNRSPWVSPGVSIWFGAIGGSLLGIIGGLIGALAGLGKARGLVLALMKTVIAFGSLCLVVGLIGLMTSQPYAVYYPLLLLGFLGVVIIGVMYPQVCRRYRDLELRRMRAQDLGAKR